MPKVIGYNDSLALVSSGEDSVVLDTEMNLIIESGKTTELATKRKWSKKRSCAVSETAMELASAALSTLEIKVVTASGRMYTVPAGAMEEAKKGLEWRKEHKRGGTPVGLNTARTLAKGGQIGIEKVRHIAKYFPRHEVDKKADGYEPGEDGFPSNGRIAWALWGGDAGWRWAKAIIEREGKKAVTADGYSLPGFYEDEGIYEEPKSYDADLNAFKLAIDAEAMDDELAVPEFIARVRMDGTGVDRLYKVDLDGKVYVWDDGSWDNLGMTVGDVYTYDSVLDHEDDVIDKDYFTIDPESAITISALLQQKPYDNISVSDIDDYEAALAKEALDDVDWNIVDYAMTAASAAPTAPGAAKAAPAGDGVYTADERSENASGQTRDATGRFAAKGNSVSIKGGKPGVITNIDKASGNVTVAHSDGTSSIVPANMTKKASQVTAVVPGATAGQLDTTEPLDTSGILGEPRTVGNKNTATLPGTLPPLTTEDTSKIIDQWPTFVAQMRANAEPANYGMPPTKVQESNAGKVNDARTPFSHTDLKALENDPKAKALEKITGVKLTLDAYSHPLLSSWLNKTAKVNGKTVTPNAIWYQPVTSAGAPEEVKKAVETKEPATKEPVANAPEVGLTPETSDVPPLFLALVSPDDPRAVMDLVSIVPASSKSSDPMTFIRDDGKWVKDVGVLQDLKSATPPPMVPLDEDSLVSVIQQVDGTQAAMAASAAPDLALMVLWGPRQDIMDAIVAGARPPSAHNIDKNKGNAEKLRRYWVSGKGAAKIRWGQGGDWKRCVRHLAKYLGPRAKGYCQLRHKEATGMYTSTHAKLERGRNNQVEEFIMEEVLTKNYGSPTVVTDRDMLIPIDDIYAESDDIYDDSWTPEPEVHDLMQDEACKRAMTAAGGNGVGAAERLRLYWTTGKGGAKIRWGTPGDWRRCVRHLEKFLGPRAKGYCALRHHDATGMWTGDKANHTHNSFAEEGVMASAMLNAQANEAKARLGLVAGAVSPGAAFSIPLIIPEGAKSGDGRSFKAESISYRDLPLPLLWQIKTADGHQGSVVVGRIDHMERTEDGIGNAFGVFDTGAYGKEAERLVRHGFIRGVSADMDQFEASEISEDELQDDGSETSKDHDGDVKVPNIVVNKARIMAVTIVPKPAFQECKIIVLEDGANTENQEENMIPDGVYVDDADMLDAEALVACGFIAGAIPMNPPTVWFENPKLNKPTPLTVTEDGRVYGHIAAWHVDHIGMAFGTRPPRSKSNYAYFHTGVCRTDEGKDVPVGQLTLAGGHAAIEASAADAVKHYDDTASSFADVHAGEDAHGIWVAGALRPGTTTDQIRAIRASAPSGDWRPIKGSLELVAVCQVNVPGFPIARAHVASGQVMALVAAGAATLAKMKHDPIADLIARVHKLEQFTTTDNLTGKAAELAARIDEVAKFGVISEEARMKLADQGKAMPDGSYPIRNKADLKNAIKAFGRAAKEDQAKVKKHIIKQAKALKATDLIPDNWRPTTASLTASAEDLKARLAAAQDSLGKAHAAEFVTIDGKYTSETQPRDSKGRFRTVLAVLKDTLGKAGMSGEFSMAAKIEKLHDEGHYVASSEAAAKLVDTVQRIKTGALNNESLQTIKLASGQLGSVLANLPLPFGHEVKRLRFSDLPDPLQKLTTQMIKRVKDRIGDEEGGQATKELESYISGGNLYNESEIQSQLSKLLRLLT